MSDDTFDGLGPDATYREYLAKGEFRIQRCTDCNQYNFYPRVLCPHCGSPAMEWVPASGQGTVYSSTAIRKRDGSHNVALVNLAEGPRMMTRIDGVDPTEVIIDSPVQARIVTEEDETFVTFEPTGGVA